MSVVLQFQRDAAYEKVLDLILSGALPVDEPLSERGLAESLSLGRTPVREAIRALARDGLLEIRPARGTFVRGIRLEQMHELYEVREALEGRAAWLAAMRGPTPELSAYRRLFERAKRAVVPSAARPAASRARVDWDETYDTGAEFHIDVVRAARNGMLLELYLPIRMQFRLAMRLGRYYDKEWILEGIDDHLGILDAIEARDAVAAQDRMCAHLAASFASKRKILAGLRDTSRSAAVISMERGLARVGRKRSPARE